MPPKEFMKLFSQTTPQELCQKWRQWVAENPADHDLLQHMSTDPLVKWSFDDHPGRAKAQGGHGEFVRLLQIWLAEKEDGLPRCF